MRLPYQRSILVIAAFALASCASSLPTRAPVLETSQTPVQRSDGQLIVKILVPRRKHPVRVRVARGRRPRYVSASTAALKLTISRGTTVVSNQVVPLTTSSANCTKTTAGTACTAGIVLKACPTKAACYTAAVSTYDAVFCNGAPPVCSIPATANLLSTGQSVAFTVETGKANAVSLTLSGVPQSTVVTIDALTNAIGGTLELIGPGAHIFTVQTLDADENIIVGPGAPTYTVSAPTGLLAGVTVATPSSAPNQIWVTPPSTFDGTNTASFSVTPTFAGQAADGCAPAQANCSATGVTVGMEQMYAIDDGGTLRLYALGESTPRVSTTSVWATGAGRGLTADNAGNIFMSAGTAMAFSPPFAYANFLCCNGAAIASVSAGGNGSAFFLATYPAFPTSQNYVTSCSVAGCHTIASILPYDQNQVMAADASGDVAYGSPGTGGGAPCFAYVYDAPNYSAPIKIAGSPFAATGCAGRVALDSNGNLFASDPSDNQIVEFSKSSAYHTATRIMTGSVSPVVLLTDSSGDLLDFATTGASGAVIQETLAGSLNANQGGSLSPDHSTTPSIAGQIENVAGAIGPDGAYFEWYACCVYQPTFAGYSLSDLTPLGAPINNQGTAPIGLLVLP